MDDVAISATGRYLRVHGTQRALPAYGYSLWELEVHGSRAGRPVSAGGPR
ncbi:hypothetical protein [Micromonospora sp. NPDC050276]